VKRGVLHCFNNSGQSCNAPTRMLVELQSTSVQLKSRRPSGEGARGDPMQPAVTSDRRVAPAIREIQRLIEKGLRGARPIVGDPEAAGFEKGYYVKPPSSATSTTG